ncbi:MAG: LptA/OstA family protein [Thermodesulfobacteriota bacterium]
MEATEIFFDFVSGGTKVALNGNVRLTQEHFTLTCDRLELVFGDGSTRPDSQDGSMERVKGSKVLNKIQFLAASGNVKIVDKRIMATAEKVIYDHVKRTLKLMEGPPRIWHGPDMQTGDPIIIYLDDYRYLDGDRAQLKRGVLP